MEVVDNREHHRFEAAIGDQRAVSYYRLGEGTITFMHTEVPESMRGGGVGGAIARAALDSARARGLKVIPLCPFFASFIQKHPEYQELVGPA